MCIECIDKVIPNVSKRNARTAYKILYKTIDGKLRSPIFDYTEHEIGKWYTDEMNGKIKVDYADIKYQTGFHAFCSKRVALKELKAARQQNKAKLGIGLFVVKLAGTITKGQNVCSGTFLSYYENNIRANVYCATQMKILKEIEVN